MNNGSTLLHPSSIQAMKTINNPNNATSSPEYGLIWNWRTIDHRRYIGHTGNMPGVANGIMINEQGNTGVILLTNGDSTLNNILSTTMSNVLTNLQVSLIRCYEI